MSLSTGIRLDQINGITSSTYGFNVLDWDNHREGRLVAKCSFGELSSDNDLEDISELPGTLEGKTAEEIAVIFNQIFQKFHFRQFREMRLEAKSLNMRICSDDTVPIQPFIFICGNKI
jgi:hypothetical protein